MRGKRGKGQISKALPTVSIKEIVQWPGLNSNRNCNFPELTRKRCMYGHMVRDAFCSRNNLGEADLM